MAKNSAYGVQTVKLAPPVPGGFPASFDGDNCFSFKAIVMDSLQLNDAAPNQTDINVEETEDIYTIPAAFGAYTKYMNIRLGQEKYRQEEKK